MFARGRNIGQVQAKGIRRLGYLSLLKSDSDTQPRDRLGPEFFGLFCLEGRLIFKTNLLSKSREKFNVTTLVLFLIKKIKKDLKMI